MYDLRLQISGAGPARPSQDTGYALLDKQGITTSEFMQQVAYQRALEGELAKTIKSIDGVKAATVHLVIPQKDVFADDQPKPTASVLVDLGAGTALSGEQVQAIVHLVASSVEGLEPDQVTVAGADGKVLSAAGTGGRGGRRRPLPGGAGFENRLRPTPQKMLDRVVGPGHAVVPCAPTSTSTSARPPRRPTPTRRAPRRSRPFQA